MLAFLLSLNELNAEHRIGAAGGRGSITSKKPISHQDKNNANQRDQINELKIIIASLQAQQEKTNKETQKQNVAISNLKADQLKKNAIIAKLQAAQDNQNELINQLNSGNTACPYNSYLSRFKQYLKFIVVPRFLLKEDHWIFLMIRCHPVAKTSRNLVTVTMASS